MKTFRTWCIAAFAILLGVLLATVASAQLNLIAISIGNTRGLSFGSFVPGSGGTVVMSPASARSATGSIVLVSSASGHSAQFTVSGDANATYTITLPANGSVVLTGPGTDMPVADFTSEPSGAGGQLDGGGSQVLSVGASLQVGSNQAAGDYSGSFTVTVNYN